jgi:hypothetical protein
MDDEEYATILRLRPAQTEGESYVHTRSIAVDLSPEERSTANRPAGK